MSDSFYIILMVIWTIAFAIALFDQKRKGKLKKVTVNRFLTAILFSIGTMILIMGFLTLWGKLV